MKGAINVKVRYVGPGRRAQSLEAWAREWSRTLPRKILVPSMKDAFRRTVRKTRTRAVRRVARATNLPVKVVKNRTYEVKGRVASIRGAVVGIAFYARPVSASSLKTRQTKKGVRAGKHSFPGAFVAHGEQNNLQVFKRRGKTRLPLDAEKIKLLDTGSFRTILARYGATYLPRRFHEQMRYRSAKLAGAGR